MRVWLWPERHTLTALAMRLKCRPSPDRFVLRLHHKLHHMQHAVLPETPYEHAALGLAVFHHLRIRPPLVRTLVCPEYVYADVHIADRMRRGIKS